MEFFADPTLADRTEGTRTVLGVPKKMPAPLCTYEKPWENELPPIPHLTFSPLYDPQRQAFRLWYRSSMRIERQSVGDQSHLDPSERRRADRRLFLCYAESKDGVVWERPELGLVDFQGSRKNNIVADPRAADIVWQNIILDPDDPDPAKRYKAIGYGGGATSLLAHPPKPGGTAGIAVAFSPDGFDWTPGVTIMDGIKDVTDMDAILPFREPTTGRWVGFFRPRTSPKRRFLGYSESADFIHWTYPRMLLAPDRDDTPWTEFYGMAVSRIGHRRLGLLWIYHNHPEHSVMSNELVYSRFGIDYHRVMPRHEFIPLGRYGDIDSRQVWPTRLLEVGDEIFIYSNIGNVEHGSDRIDAVTPGNMQKNVRCTEGETPIRGIGLARLPWGHFCGLRPDHEGMVETRWLDNYGARGARIVAKIEPGGTIRAGIHDVYGRLMPGYEPECSRLEPGPRGTFRLVWGDGRDGRYGEPNGENKAVGHVLKLRFELYRATLFGVEIGAEGAAPEMAGYTTRS